MSSRRSSVTSDGQEFKHIPEFGYNNEIETQLESDSSLIHRSLIEIRFPIYVESITGTTFKLDVFPTDTIHQMKEQLENTELIPVRQQHLFWRYRELTNECKLGDYGIGCGARLQLVIDLTTGPVARSPEFFNKGLDLDLNPNEDSKPLTLLLFQNGNQIKVISITTNDNIVSAKCTKSTNSANRANSATNYLGSNDNLSKALNIERSEQRLREDKQLKEKMNEILIQMKSLSLRNNKINAKQDINDLNSSEQTNASKLPHLANNHKLNDLSLSCSNNHTKPKTSVHLPPIPMASKSNELIDNNFKSESTGVEKQLNFKYLFIYSNDLKTISMKRRFSLTSNYKITNKVNRLDVSEDCTNISVSQLRPLTAPVVNSIYVKDNNFMNKLTQKETEIHKKLLKSQNSAKNKRLNSGRRLPPIETNAKKKGHKIRCTLCHLKLGLVNRYNCRCGHIFCAKHRYSETHFCSYDYKSEGQKYIKENNPIICAEKLPKI